MIYSPLITASRLDKSIIFCLDVREIDFISVNDKGSIVILFHSGNSLILTGNDAKCITDIVNAWKHYIEQDIV